MSEYIKNQPEATVISAGDWLVFDTGSGTFKISRQNLLGQIDLNQNAIAQNVADISSNASNITSNANGVTQNSNNISDNSAILAAIMNNTILYGIRFDGTSTYMNLGIVPLINSSDSYVRMKFKGTNWVYSSPFGYTTSGNTDRFYVYRDDSAGRDVYVFQKSGETFVTPQTYPDPDRYQSFDVEVSAVNVVDAIIGSTNIVSQSGTVYQSQSPIDFYIGARNLNGTADRFAECIFTEITFFNGVDTKVFNHANNWNDATNYGGIPVYSLDNGQTWSDI